MKINSAPKYILSATPVDDVVHIDLFNTEADSVRWSLENPKNIRRGGWGLPTNGTISLHEDYLENKWWDVQRVRLYKDGTFAIMSKITSDFLAWRSEPEEFIRINSIALIEVTYNFVGFYLNLLDRLQQQETCISFGVQMLGLFVNKEQKVFLAPGEAGSPAHDIMKDLWKPAPEPDLKFALEKCALRPSWSDREKQIGEITFALVKRIYLWFGLTEKDDIPYRSSESDAIDLSLYTQNVESAVTLQRAIGKALAS